MLTFVSHVAAQSFTPITLGVPNFKPYTYLKHGEIKGSAIDKTTPILKKMGVNVSLKHYENYSLLLKALKRQEIDGFFLASQNAERDQYAEFSEPIAFNNWAWFSLKDKTFKYTSDEFKYSRTIGTIGKTNTFRWLTRNGFQVHSAPVSQLPSLLLNKKVDAVFSAESVFMQACKDLGVNTKSFKKKVHQKRPFGMYISKKYLWENPTFMKTLNQLIIKQP